MSMEEAMASVRAIAKTVSMMARPEFKKQMARVQKRAGDLDTRTRSAVKESPIAAVGTALLAGYAIGRIRAMRRGNGAWNSRHWWTS